MNKLILGFSTHEKCCKNHYTIIKIKIYKDLIVSECDDCGKITEKKIQNDEKPPILWCKHPNNFVL